MRDRVSLAAHVYIPKQGEGRYPVIVERTPYSKGECRYSAAEYLVRRGYAVVIEDERGRYNSDGVYYWWRDTAWGERQDGYDTIEWAAGQRRGVRRLDRRAGNVCFNKSWRRPAISATA